MAETINLVCLDCREFLWIGQIPTGNRDSAYIYADPERKHALFLLKHWKHKLTVVNDNNRVFDDPAMKEFEARAGLKIDTQSGGGLQYKVDGPDDIGLLPPEVFK